jgi:hypothetical protein
LSIEYFEGLAGSGKTFQLTESLKLFLKSHPLQEDEAILGITYMHGSRRRMHARLAEIAELRGRYVACTVDSVARNLVCRWRSLARVLDPQLDLAAAPEFAGICRVAALLANRECVSAWLKAHYPLVVVDELQDCREDRLSIVQALASCCHLIVAADGFQDLQCTGASPAVEWLHGSGGKKNILTGNRRTKQPVLLRAAARLRSSADCGDILGRNLISALNANVAASGVARTLHWRQPKDAVILTPTGPEKCPWIGNVVTRLVSKPIKPSGIQTNVGPFNIAWESNVEEERTDLLAKLGHLSQCASLPGLQSACSHDSGALGDLYRWAEHKFRIKGQVEFSSCELGMAVDRILQSRRAFLPTTSLGAVRAMTINQAKNREFEGVIVLWPFMVGGDLESLRRRLYNALTRAQKWAVIIVQDDPKESRLTKPPFSMRTAAAAS